MRDDACSSIVVAPWLAVNPFTRRFLADQYAHSPEVLTSDALCFTMMRRRKNGAPHMASLTEGGKDRRYTMADLAADLSDLIAMGLVAVTGEYPDLRYIVTSGGEAELRQHEAAVNAEARELQMRRYAAQLDGELPGELRDRGA
jgi:hypothetical protein